MIKTGSILRHGLLGDRHEQLASAAWYPPSAEELSAGSKAAAAAAALGGRTDRERNYIDAISAFYRNSETLDHHTRAVAYEKAMEKDYLRYPDDREAALFYALAQNATASPSDKTYSDQKKAASDIE